MLYEKARDILMFSVWHFLGQISSTNYKGSRGNMPLRYFYIPSFTKNILQEAHVILFPSTSTQLFASIFGVCRVYISPLNHLNHPSEVHKGPSFIGIALKFVIVAFTFFGLCCDSYSDLLLRLHIKCYSSISIKKRDFVT